MCCLLQKHSVGSVYLANIYCYFLSRCESIKVNRRTTWHTNFCAEKIEFIMGMYDVDKSGETERIRIRGSGNMDGSSAALVDVDGWVMRLISSSVYSDGDVYVSVPRLTTKSFRHGADQCARGFYGVEICTSHQYKVLTFFFIISCSFHLIYYYSHHARVDYPEWRVGVCIYDLVDPRIGRRIQH